MEKIPELMALQYGVNLEFYGVTPESVRPVTSLAIPFACNKSSQYPNQVEEIIHHGVVSTYYYFICTCTESPFLTNGKFLPEAQRTQRKNYVVDFLTTPQRNGHFLQEIGRGAFFSSWYLTLDCLAGHDFDFVYEVTVG